MGGVVVGQVYTWDGGKIECLDKRNDEQNLWLTD